MPDSFEPSAPVEGAAGPDGADGPETDVAEGAGARRSEPIRVLVVDDHALFRRGLEIVLAQESDIQVVGEAGDGAEAVDKAADLLPDIVLMDVRMPKRGGIEACTSIKEVAPSAKIIMLTISDEEAEQAADGVPTTKAGPLDVQGEGPLVVREKTHAASPMTLGQALYAMELVGHDFYLFVDAERNQPSVVYRRHGCDYGVIYLKEDPSAGEAPTGAGGALRR